MQANLNQRWFHTSPASLFSESCEGSPDPWWTVAVTGLLTRFSFFRLPIRLLAHSGVVEKVLPKLTAAGTVQDFHPIPFYSRKRETKAAANVNVVVLRQKTRKQ
jgi:hypothetical protein